MRNPSQIKNKAKRTQVYSKYKAEKKKVKKRARDERAKQEEELGALAPPRQIPKTLENTRKHDDTMVDAEDDEIIGDEQDDEFAKFFSNEVKPKIMITTRPKCSRKLYPFIGDLMQMIPNAFYYPRESHLITAMAEAAVEKGFTHLITLAEKNKVCNGLLITLLPRGPTAFFRLSSFVAGAMIPGHGKPTSHVPELILNQFKTRLGRRVSRLLGSLYSHEPQYEGRQVVTFHNQRDFIFVRHHRYIYKQEEDTNIANKKLAASATAPTKKEKNRAKAAEKDVSNPSQLVMKTRARLQELGPRFTLKLKWLQEGLMDTQCGEYEWINSRTGQMKSASKKFFL